jgi:hypothetical protein
LVLGAIGPLTFLIVNLLITKATALGAHPPEVASALQTLLLKFHGAYPDMKPISPEIAGFSSFALAFVGMLAGSLLSKPETPSALQPQTAA